MHDGRVDGWTDRWLGGRLCTGRLMKPAWAGQSVGDTGGGSPRRTLASAVRQSQKDLTEEAPWRRLRPHSEKAVVRGPVQTLGSKTQRGPVHSEEEALARPHEVRGDPVDHSRAPGGNGFPFVENTAVDRTPGLHDDGDDDDCHLLHTYYGPGLVLST